MTQPLKAKLVSMLEVVYPELDCDFLAEVAGHHGAGAQPGPAACAPE